MAWKTLALAVLCVCYSGHADIVTCACDASRPETLAARQCSLCREAEKQPADVRVFVLKDINPTKPGRWLVLPRAHDRSLDQLSAADRTELISTAIAKGRELFGDDWGVAYNAPQVQTQCHVHLHVGRYMRQVEEPNFVTVASAAEVPAPAPGEGFWIHQEGTKLHVHTGGLIAETVLER